MSIHTQCFRKSQFFLEGRTFQTGSGFGKDNVKGHIFRKKLLGMLADSWVRGSLDYIFCPRLFQSSLSTWVGEHLDLETKKVLPAFWPFSHTPRKSHRTTPTTSSSQGHGRWSATCEDWCAHGWLYGCIKPGAVGHVIHHRWQVVSINAGNPTLLFWVGHFQLSADRFEGRKIKKPARIGWKMIYIPFHSSENVCSLD